MLISIMLTLTSATDATLPAQVVRANYAATLAALNRGGASINRDAAVGLRLGCERLELISCDARQTVLSLTP